jgi:hypothetical protein
MKYRFKIRCGMRYSGVLEKPGYWLDEKLFAGYIISPQFTLKKFDHD